MNKLTITLPIAAKPRLSGVYPTIIGTTRPWPHPFTGFSVFTVGHGWGGTGRDADEAALLARSVSYPDKRAHVVLEDAQESGWFGPEEKPNWPGVYKTRLFLPGGVYVDGYSFWTGTEWRNNWPTPERAADDEGRGIQNKAWKGLYDATKYEVNK